MAKNWSTPWGRKPAMRLGDGFGGNGSLGRFMQAPGRQFRELLRPLGCGHAGMRPAALWLWIVAVDLCREGRQTLCQAELIEESGLARSTAKRALGELERAGMLTVSEAEITWHLPNVAETRASLASTCPQCPASRRAALRFSATEAANPAVKPQTRFAHLLPEWAGGQWYENLKRRVGEERAVLACVWTAVRVDQGERIANPRGYAAAVAEVYAGRRQGFLGDEKVPADRVVAGHAAAISEWEAANRRTQEKEEAEAGWAALVERGLVPEGLADSLRMAGGGG